ncbi:MAG TPA: hypothetical protein VHZ52_13265 [Acidobacteriaceae bacterium]|jgi:hypothetical protein|nr:hypothetical protein [Acidobacteriaceae bacterium]
MKIARLLAVALMILFSAFVRSAQGQFVRRNSASPETCQAAPDKLEHGAIHILRVKVLSSQSTDGTYADEGYGQGEFDTVKLLGVVKSPIRWTPGLVFRVHPFPGKRGEGENFAPEHLIIGKQYYLAYTYYLEEEPHGDSDLIGLTRCGVHEDTPAARKELLDALSH